MAKNFNFGNVSAGRDVNVDASVDNSTTVTINYTELARELQQLASTPEEQVQINEFAQAVEKHDEPLASKILSGMMENAPLVIKICKTLFKLVF